MSVRDTLLRKDMPNEIELRAELKMELDHPRESREPEIIIERPNPSTTHLYVIWSKWKDLEQIIRSRIILDVYEEAKGPDEFDKVTAAMGLTPDEASRLGIK